MQKGTRMQRESQGMAFFPPRYSYVHKTQARKERIVRSFPSINPTSTVEDIRELFNIIDTIQVAVNAGNLSKDLRRQIEAKLKLNNALPQEFNEEHRECLLADLILAATCSPKPFWCIPGSLFQNFNYFGRINYTQTIQDIISKIKSQFWEYPNGDIFMGSFNEKGEGTGYGTKTYDNGSHYVGYWKNGQPDGQGTCTYAAGSGSRYRYNPKKKYEGNWQNGQYHGQGTLTYSNGGKYQGTFFHSRYHGRGKIIYPDGKIHEGNWNLGEYCGKYTVKFQEAQEVMQESESIAV